MKYFLGHGNSALDGCLSDESGMPGIHGDARNPRSESRKGIYNTDGLSTVNHRQALIDLSTIYSEASIFFSFPSVDNGRRDGAVRYLQ